MAASRKQTVKKQAGVGKQVPARSKAAPRKVAVRRGAGRDGAARQAQDSAARAPEQTLLKTLRAEHRHIAAVMELFSDQLRALEEGETVDAQVVFEVMEYMANWPDHYHHPREDLIYARVAELDRKAADDVDTLQRDHDRSAKRGGALLRDIERWREGELPASAIVRAGREYVSHAYEHMNVEEKVVFPHIESVLSPDDWRELAEDDRVRAVSLPILGPRVQREFRNLSRRLRRGLRHRVERGVTRQWLGIEALMESLGVLSMACDSAWASAADHWSEALGDSREMFRQAPVTAPLKVALNNTRLGIRLLGEVIEISRETYGDLEQVSEERRQRARLLQR